MRLFWFFTAILFLTPIISLAQPIPPPGDGPGFTSTPQSLQEVVQSIFNLALLVSGILAFGAVIYGAFMYTFSAGNPGMQSDARDQIMQAFLGLALLLGSYLVLNTINPNLTRISLSPLPAITAPKTQAFEPTAGCPPCPSPQSCFLIQGKPKCSDPPVGPARGVSCITSSGTTYCTTNQYCSYSGGTGSCVSFSGSNRDCQVFSTTQSCGTGMTCFPTPPGQLLSGKCVPSCGYGSCPTGYTCNPTSGLCASSAPSLSAPR